jgi:hypothetical protein
MRKRFFNSQQPQVPLAASKLAYVDIMPMKQFEIKIAQRCLPVQDTMPLMSIPSTSDQDG